MGMTWIGTNKVVADFSPPLLLTPVVRAFADLATALPNDNLLSAGALAKPLHLSCLR
jgi:hypothetical protein